jgi:hypothetical protein
MSTFVKIFKSDNVEAEERHIEKLKKEIEFLTEDLQIRENHLMKMRNSNQK